MSWNEIMRLTKYRDQMKNPSLLLELQTWLPHCVQFFHIHVCWNADVGLGRVLTILDIWNIWHSLGLVPLQCKLWKPQIFHVCWTISAFRPIICVIKQISKASSALWCFRSKLLWSVIKRSIVYNNFCRSSATTTPDY